MVDKKKLKVKVIEDGSYLVTGEIPLSEQIIVCDENGDSRGWKKGKSFDAKEKCSLCRCGKSKNHPYCDGMHKETNFDGKETASRKTYEEQVEIIKGGGVTLGDVRSLCAGARFCDIERGVWQLAADSDDLKSKELCIKEAELCPSGRLVAIDKKTGEACEPECDPSIGLVQDPERKVSGPLYLKGGIPIESADGFKYEVRNRQALCRCGESANKPFCDGSHISCGFRDGIIEEES